MRRKSLLQQKVTSGDVHDDTPPRRAVRGGSTFPAVGRPGVGHQPAGGEAPGRQSLSGAARRYGHGQNLCHGAHHCQAWQAHDGPLPQQDAGCTAGQGAQELSAHRGGGAFRVVLQLLPTGVLSRAK
eukprot:scaffold29_cov251-Pinguiococcus_pyrenoidosus.AAC.14